MTEPNPNRLLNTMERFGYTEKEARVFIHLVDAERLLNELTDEDGAEEDSAPSLGNIIWRETHVRESFASLHRRLAMRVLRRDYPKGFGSGISLED